MDKKQLIGRSHYAGAEQLLDAFHSAAGRSDLATYFGCFHPIGRFLGTDPYENWSCDELFEYAKPHFLAGNGWKYTVVMGSRKISYFPPGADESSASFCTFDELLRNEAFGLCRGTGSLSQDEKGRWLIAAYHLSFPIPNDLAGDITKHLREFNETDAEKRADAAAADLLAELALDEESVAKGGNSNGGGKNDVKKKKKKTGK